jgi:hypothetical protein
MGETSRRLRGICILAMLPIFSSGCAYVQLRKSTLRQASTITELQYQQVLNNLAMLSYDPFALPTMLALKNGTAQVADSGNAGVGLSINSGVVATAPTLSATRSVVEQWGTSPVADDTTLRLLRSAYRAAMGSNEPLSLDDANDLAHSLSAQIGTNADISTDSDTLKSLIALYRGDASMTLPAEHSADASAAPASLVNVRERESDGQAAAAQPPPETGLVPLPGEARRTDAPPARRPGARPAGNEQPPSSVGTGQRADTPQAKKPGPKEVIDAPGVTPGPFTISNLHKAYRDLDQAITSTLDEPVLKLSDDRASFVAAKPVATGLAKETIRQVNSVRQTLATIPSGWYGTGSKKEIPSDALYVGHFRDAYCWVCRSGCEDLSEFTLAILNLSSLIKDSQVFTVPAGVQFSPALTGRP